MHDREKRDEAALNKSIRVYEGLTREISATLAGKYGFSSRLATDEERYIILESVIKTRAFYNDKLDIINDFYFGYDQPNCWQAVERDRGFASHIAVIAATDGLSWKKFNNGNQFQVGDIVDGNEPLTVVMKACSHNVTLLKRLIIVVSQVVVNIHAEKESPLYRHLLETLRLEDWEKLVHFSHHILGRADFDQRELKPRATFTDARGTYNVDLILEWVSKNTLPVSDLPVESLSNFLSFDTWGDTGAKPSSNLKHLLEDPVHLKRVHLANLEQPVILTNFNIIVDGVHRLSKAVYEGHPTIKAIYIDQSILETFKIDRKFREKLSSIIPDAPIPDIRLYLPKERLPKDPIRRRDILEDYFSDQLPTATYRDNEWEVLLERPASPYGCYQLDPEIREGLTWWERGTRIRDISFAHRFLKGGLLAIEDQWMPLSWSRCFQRLGSVPKELILLHLDDHKDMMSPRIGKRLDGELVDYITGKHVSFMKPETIEEAILSGSIGKGSILTPLIHKVDKIHVRHLSFRPNGGETFKIVTSLGRDDVLSPISNRLEIHLDQKPWDILGSSSSYVVTSDEDVWLTRLPDDLPILLHIDMDFFNDRFDGDGNWERDLRRTHNANVKEQKAIADRVFQALEKQQLEKRIIDVCIGISASFYPSEYWSTMVPYVIQKCRKLGIVDNAV